MAVVEATANQAIGAEAVTITAPSFTAVASRLYRITYYEPRVDCAGSGNATTLRIRLTNASGTILGGGIVFNAGSTGAQPFTVVNYATFSAGPVVVVGTIAALSGTATRTTDIQAQLMIEDMGPA
jgi:phage baseplate assembly protein gpV